MLLAKIREFDIPVVETILQFTNVDSLVTFTRGLENVEGFVVAFDDGHRVKIKADQYVRIHKTLERIIFDRNIVDLIINEEVDDVIPMLPQVQADRVRDFETRFWTAFTHKENRLYGLRIATQQTYEDDRKRVALEFIPILENKADAPFIFRMLDGHDLRELMLDHVRKSVSSNTKWDQTAAWLGMS
jgi:RNA ligase